MTPEADLSASISAMSPLPFDGAVVELDESPELVVDEDRRRHHRQHLLVFEDPPFAARELANPNVDTSPFDQLPVEPAQPDLAHRDVLQLGATVPGFVSVADPFEAVLEEVVAIGITNREQGHPADLDGGRRGS